MTTAPYGIQPPAFRLPEALRLGPVRLSVSDLGRSMAFYEDVLGLRAERDGAAAARLRAADGRVLIELQSGPGVKAAPRGAVGLYHFAILLPGRDDLGRVLQHLVGAGVHPGMADHLVSEALYLSDPDGLGIEVYADRPRAGWRRQGRELAMATDPLDARGVMAAAGDTAWAGMPAGTVMGHVHLHVGDLDTAAAFYHAALGLDKVVWSYPGALFMSAGGYHHHLGTNTWARGAAPRDDQARLLSWDLIVPREDEARAAAASLAVAGYGVRDEAGVFMAADPWGTALRIAADRNQDR